MPVLFKKRTWFIMFFFCLHMINKGGERVIEIKGYISWSKENIPITWERETKDFVYEVKRVRNENGVIYLDKRLFDDRVPKAEIIADASVFKIPCSHKGIRGDKRKEMRPSSLSS